MTRPSDDWSWPASTDFELVTTAMYRAGVLID